MIKFEGELEDLLKLVHEQVVAGSIPAWYGDKPTALCLRTIDADGTASWTPPNKGFKWPAIGLCEALDWKPTAECGYGLHGYLKGCGDAESILWDGLFQVVKVIESEIIDLGGKIKFPRCEVIFTGSQKDATDILVNEYGNIGIIGATVVVGDGQHAIAGDYGTATAGNNGTATAGNNGTAMAGDYGTATAGDYGKATAGDYGKATVGDDGTAKAGEMGRISILYWDGHRCREVIGYVGENGIEPNVAYNLNEMHEFIKA